MSLALSFRAASRVALCALFVTACSSSDAAPPPAPSAGGGGAAGAGGAGGGAGGAAGSSTALALPPGCNPLLGGADCFLPYPSDFFRVADATLPSGFRIETSGAAKMKAGHGGVADVSAYRPLDGYSRMAPIVALLGSPVSHAGLSGVLEPPEATLAASSPTLLIEAATGALIPHFVDVDAREEDPSKQALVIHPLVGLKEKTRYVVALHGVKGPGGDVAAAPEGFRRLRDKVTGDPELSALAARYESDVFALTTQVGVARAELQLAWDFSTGSDEHIAADMLRVRELTIAWLAANTPTVTITEVKENPFPETWRTIHGTVQIPLFLTQNPKDDPNATLARDPSGAVTQNGTSTVPFVAHVPVAVRDTPGPGRALGYGHGFFGSTDELASDSARTIFGTIHAVTFGIDWWGMSKPDLGPVADTLTSDPGLIFAFEDRVHQAMSNWIVLMAAVKTTMKVEPAFHRPLTGAGSDPSGASLYDDTLLDFLGISQGHILAGTLAALHPTIDRFCLNVGGAGLATMMFRAQPFGQFLLLLNGPMSLPQKLDQQKFAAAAQRQFDRIDPGFWASRVLKDKLPGSPPGRLVLQQAGLGDTAVPNLGSFLHARMLGISQITPSARAVFGLEQVTAPIANGSAFALWDFGIDDSFSENAAAAPLNSHVHDLLRIQPTVLQQMNDFFQPSSVITNPCNGVCKGSK